MSEQLISNEKRRVLSIVAATGLGITALAGCAEPTSEGLSPEDRVIFGYESFYDEGCLRETSYDVAAGQRGRSSFTPPTLSYDKATDILTITPTQGSSLELTGFTQHEAMVSAVNEESQKILDSYGCEHRTYEK